jgi:hypothetical protein
MGDDRLTTSTYTTDGKECVNHMGENELKSTLKWDGDDLTVESKGSFGGERLHRQRPLDPIERWKDSDRYPALHQRHGRGRCEGSVRETIGAF